MLFSTWPAYALVGAGALGIWLTQNAFSAGPLQASLPAISAGEPLIGILLGVIVFGDRIQISPGLLAIQAGGVAALVAGVVMVASDPALSQLREQASKPRRRPRYRQRRRYACCRRVRVNCSTACSTAAAHCPGDWGTMTCASCSTDASRYGSGWRPSPAPSCAGPVADAEMDKPAPAARGGEAIAAADAILTVPTNSTSTTTPTSSTACSPTWRPRSAGDGRAGDQRDPPRTAGRLAPYHGSALSTARARLSASADRGLRQVSGEQSCRRTARSQAAGATRSPDRRRTDDRGDRTWAFIRTPPWTARRPVRAGPRRTGPEPE